MRYLLTKDFRLKLGHPLEAQISHAEKCLNYILKTEPDCLISHPDGVDKVSLSTALVNLRTAHNHLASGEYQKGDKFALEAFKVLDLFIVPQISLKELIKSE